MNTNYNRGTVGRSEWIVIILISMVPVFNIIKLIMLATSTDVHPVVSNYARAMLWVICVGAGLAAVGTIILMVVR